MSQYPIKLLKDESGIPFVPLTSLQAVAGEEYIQSVFVATEASTGHFVITNDKMRDEDLLNRVIAVSFPDTLKSATNSYLRLNDNDEYLIYDEDGSGPLLIKDFENIVCFLMRKELSWQLIKTGAAAAASGGGHTILDGENNLMPQQAILQFKGFGVSNNDSLGATVISTPSLINNLSTSTSGSGPLDAYQGKVLNDKFENYLPNTGGTINGNLVLGEHMFWKGTKNIYCAATGNDQEWSFDLGSDFDNGQDYTGCYAQFWSKKKSDSIIRFYNDDAKVEIPNGGLHVGYAPAWHNVDNNYSLRLGSNSGRHLDLGYDGMQAKKADNTADTIFLNYNGGNIQLGKSDKASHLSVYGRISMPTEYSVQKPGNSYSWSTIRDSNDSAIVSITSYSGYQPAVKQKTPSGVWGIGAYTSDVHITYFADGTTHNSPTQLLELNYNGNAIRAGGVNIPHVWVQSGQPSAKQAGDIWFIT